MPFRHPIHVPELRRETGSDQHAERDAVHNEAIPHERVEKRHERAPHDQCWRQQYTKNEEEHRHIEWNRNLGIERLLSKDHRDRKRCTTDDDKRHRCVCQDFACEHRCCRHGRCAEDRTQSAALFTHQTLDRVEKDEKTQQKRKRVEHTRSRRTRGNQKRRVERPQTETRRGPCLDKNEWSKEPNARRAKQRARFESRDIDRTAHKAGRARS